VSTGDCIYCKVPISRGDLGYGSPVVTWLSVAFSIRPAAGGAERNIDDRACAHAKGAITEQAGGPLMNGSQQPGSHDLAVLAQVHAGPELAGICCLSKTSDEGLGRIVVQDVATVAPPGEQCAEHGSVRAEYPHDGVDDSARTLLRIACGDGVYVQVLECSIGQGAPQLVAVADEVEDGHRCDLGARRDAVDGEVLLRILPEQGQCSIENSLDAPTFSPLTQS